MSLALNTKHLSSFIKEEEYQAIYPQVEAAHKMLEAKKMCIRDRIVSSDVIGMRYGSLFDSTQTMVAKIDDDTYQVQVVSCLLYTSPGALAVDLNVDAGFYFKQSRGGTCTLASAAITCASTWVYLLKKLAERFG